MPAARERRMAMDYLGIILLFIGMSAMDNGGIMAIMLILCGLLLLTLDKIKPQAKRIIKKFLMCLVTKLD